MTQRTLAPSPYSSPPARVRARYRSGGSLVARALPGVVSVVVATFLWWLATEVSDNPLIAQFGPQYALPAIGELWRQGVLVDDILVSTSRLLVGLLVAVVVGVPFGVLLGTSTLADRAARPVVSFLRMISPLAWAPIAVALFGIGSRPVHFLVAAAAVWPIVINSAHGVRTVDQKWRTMAISLGASRTEVLRHIVLPAASGSFLTGLRLALGVAWIVLVPAEMLGVTSGLGYQILNSRDQLAYDQVVGVIVVIGILGFTLDWLAQRLLTPSRRDR
ncbi:ABC transporter permease [Nocardioides rotundus]|uniref:ABC transporter permease n=1 Tax=Nocardioides rotundus TaxID=1774216 RepID=UPI001CBD9B18|nr:ABC transporter permease [Nocardioides rotundus]UAL28530.1 ABC transporter permease [Nocardioides rotundus]